MPTTDTADDVTRSSVHLDAARGVAALIVCLGHIRGLFFASLTAPQPVAQPVAQTSQASVVPVTPQRGPGINIGAEAVMIFFVLSGYLVGGSVLRTVKRKTFEWKSYFIKRLTRLWVVLIPAVLFGWALDHIGLLVFPQPDSIYTGPSGQATMGPMLAQRLDWHILLGNIFFLQGVLTDTLGSNLALWSLSCEFWYYVAFPLLILAFAKSFRLNAKLWMRVAYLAAAVLVGFFVKMNFFWLFLIWALGAAIAALPLTLNHRLARVLSGIMACVMAVAIVFVRRTPVSDYTQEWIIALLFGCLLYLVLHDTEKAKPGPYKSIAGFFSRISYTLYLVHVPVAVFLCAIIDKPWRRWPLDPLHVSIVLALTAFVILFGYLFYLAFEANTDRVRIFLTHRRMAEQHVPTS